ncbi:MAG: ABC-F family ATP-binding cassette domain-containing protein [Candidatus ainarchaeum sp.]|nr:ABC-F family ATP-binding cassette domain-containing protein [Candidatus ainarchaeum sp.]
MALDVKNLSITIGSKEIFLDETFGLGDGSKTGLIGKNGAGKTTLLKAILKQIDYHGEIKFDGKAAYFSQHIGIDPTKTVGETLGEKVELHHQNQFEKEMQDIESLIATEEVANDAERLSKLMEKYVELQTKLADQENNSPTNKLKSVLAKLEIKDEWLDQPISSLSTGQRAIISLAQILSSNAEFLLLDEPTNHLDFKRLQILEDFLYNFRGTVLIVTHDRYFLDQVCDTILKIEKGRLIKYNGNYSDYVKSREAAFASQQSAYENELRYLAQEKDKIARLGTGPAKVKQGKYRIKLLEKREVIEKPDMDRSKFKAFIPSSEIQSTWVLDVKDLSIGYTKPLAKNINFSVGVGERVILVGENGIGKSTLFKTIEGRVDALSGEVKLHHQTVLGYVDQELKDLNVHLTLYDEIFAITQDKGRARQQLSLMGFITEEEVSKEISKLSFGEKARLNLLKVLLTKPNLLLLDEPTNHLDIDAREIIENAFLQYDGAILAVSHDKYFIKKIAQRILKISNNSVVQTDWKG